MSKLILWIQKVFNTNKAQSTLKPDLENNLLIKIFTEKNISVHKKIAQWYGEPGIDHVLVPVLYAFIDYSLFFHGKNQNVYSKSLEEYVFSKEYKSQGQKDYHLQVLSVFATAVNNKTVRGEWWHGKKQTSNPIFDTMLFLGDLLLDENMVGNYSTFRIPIKMMDISLLMRFDQIMIKEVYPDLMSIFERIKSLK